MCLTCKSYSYKTNRGSKAFLLAVSVMVEAWKAAVDECEPAATDVHTQFLGLNGIFTQELRLDNQSRKTLYAYSLSTG